MPATSPPLFVGLVVAVPKAPALVGCGNPIRLRGKLDMLIVEEKIRIAAMPVANARKIELGNDVWEGEVYLVGDIRLWLNSKNDVDEGWAVAHRDHLSRNYYPIGGGRCAGSRGKIHVTTQSGIIWRGALASGSEDIIAVIG